MKHLSESEIGYFGKVLTKARKDMPHAIANPAWHKIGWARMRMSVLGKYSHITGKITLNSRYQHSPEYLVSTLAHELHHQWQHESWGIKYVLLANFLTRDKYIERTAREVEQYIDGFIGMEGMRDGDK